MASPTERTNPITTVSLPLLSDVMASPTKRTNLNITNSPPSLPSELLLEILSRLPVKLLLQFCCVCKSFNSIIFDPYFVRKHLNMSITRRTHFACYHYQFHIKSYPLESMFTDITTIITDLGFPFSNNISENLYHIACSCHGILCLVDHYQYTVVLCNPSIRKFKKLPAFETPQVGSKLRMVHGFGYDHVSDHYKVVVLYHWGSSVNYEDVTPMIAKVLTLGIDHYWRTIPMFHFGAIIENATGKCVSGAVNWLAYTKFNPLRHPFIVSFDLVKESFQKFSVPDHGRRHGCKVTLFVWRDCLGIIFDHDVWVMNTYGVEESWIKLFSVSYLQDPAMSSILTKASYICDGQLLLELREKMELIVYDSKNGTFRITKYKYAPEVCVESLLTPDII